MPPMPPIPPAPGMAGSSFFGTSATTTSVVIARPATEAACCRAERVTLVGSQDAHGDHVAELAGGGVVAVAAFAGLDVGHDHARFFTGVGHDGAQRGFQRTAGDGDAQVLVFVDALPGQVRAQHLAVEEQQGRQCLTMRGDRNLALVRQPGQKCLDFAAAQGCRVTHTVETDEGTNPVDISLFGW